MVTPSAVACSSGPLISWAMPRLMSFHGAEVAWYVFWQERNSSRSSGVAIPVALKKSSYWRIRWARDLSDSPLGAMQ